MKPKYLVMPLVTVFLAITGCIDNNYDLSDIDTTTEVKVNNLTLPINLDAITLNDIIDTDDSQIKIITLDGKEIYAVTQSGEFEAEDIEIAGFTATAQNINPVESVFKLNSADVIPAAKYSTRAGSLKINAKYNLKSSPIQNIDYTASSLDKSLISIDYMTCDPMVIKFSLSTTGTGSNTTMRFNKIVLNFIKGLSLKSLPSNYTYDPVTGLLTIVNLDFKENKAEIILTAVGADMIKAGCKIENHILNFRSAINLKEAELEMTTEMNEGSSVSSEIKFSIDTEVEPLVAKSFNGQVQYNLEGNGLSIDPVMLDDLPDFLNNDQTNILLSNPQIYISVSNPVAENNLSFQTGMTLTAVRDNEDKTFSLDNNGKINIAINNGSGPYNFVLSPAMPDNPLTGYANGLKHVAFSGLSEVLSGNGLPSEIKIDLIDPELPLQSAINFPLNTKLPALKGTYDFLAPLALERNSRIIYTDTEDGWGDEDLAKLTVNTLEITADVTSMIPLGATVTIVPLYKNNFDDETEEAKPIAGVKGETMLPANAKDYPLSITIKGEIKRLDGIKISAIAEPGSTEALGPKQTIILKNVRATVSGSYTTDF